VTDVDDAIAKYRRQVEAEAKLAESDLDELEEHLRELTDELRTTGMSAAEAVTEAARRLGDPRQLAREHVRVRSPFGAPLSAARAWSAAAILGIIVMLVETWVELSVFVLMPIALVARKTWARGLVLGVTVHFLLARWLLRPHFDGDPLVWLGTLGVVAFVMPWRRREISPAAIALALQAWAFGSAAWGDMSFLEQYETNVAIGLVSAAAACFGTVYRARWSAIASAISALALSGMMFSELGELVLSRREFNGYWIHDFATVGTGAIAASVATFLVWRTKRAATGTFRSLTQTQ